ncbi:MAG: hypothetical protein J1F61_06890, partial [Clostridiales bacterium]|nr:hypothetical protein [Clostridiales bacterium]
VPILESAARPKKGIRRRRQGDAEVVQRLIPAEDLPLDAVAADLPRYGQRQQSEYPEKNGENDFSYHAHRQIILFPQK